MTLHRRALLALMAGAALAAPLRALALTETEAQAFVRDLADRLVAVVSGASATDARADEFLVIFRETAALPQIGRFTMGLAWRQMDDAQKEAFQKAFERYAARVYASRIGEYNGQTLEVRGSQDAGQRGILVNSVLRSPGQQDIRIDWLVSDRGGDVRVVDIVAEGVSLSITQREEFAAMLERRGGDIDRFIADLGA